MRNIAIVGGGQAGLLLALGLQNHGYPVTLVNNRHSEEIRCGKFLSSQCLFHTALEIEHKLGIEQWEPLGSRHLFADKHNRFSGKRHSTHYRQPRLQSPCWHPDCSYPL